MRGHVWWDGFQSALRQLAVQCDEPLKCECAMQSETKGHGELDQLEAAIAKHDAELKRVTDDAADAEAGVAAVEQELANVGGAPMQEQRGTVDNLKQVRAGLCFPAVHHCCSAYMCITARPHGATHMHHLLVQGAATAARVCRIFKRHRAL